MPRTAPLLLALLALAGCRTVVEAPEGEVDRRALYQAIANALPEAEFGWGEPPAIAEMSASAKAEEKPPEPQALKATERGFRVRYQAYRTRTAWIPYEAIEEVSYAWDAMPNALFAALIVVPYQVGRCTVVFDATQVEGLLDRLNADVARLESISREIGMGGPWSHAQEVKWKIEDDAAAYGQGRLAVHFNLGSGVPAWIPYGGASKDLAEAFAWAAANPDAEELPDEAEASDAPGDEDVPADGS
jgi:hypothetical protein